MAVYYQLINLKNFKSSWQKLCRILIRCRYRDIKDTRENASWSELKITIDYCQDNCKESFMMVLLLTEVRWSIRQALFTWHAMVRDIFSCIYEFLSSHGAGDKLTQSIDTMSRMKFIHLCLISGKTLNWTRKVPRGLMRWLKMKLYFGVRQAVWGVLLNSMEYFGSTHIAEWSFGELKFTQ